MAAPSYLSGIGYADPSTSDYMDVALPTMEQYTDTTHLDLSGGYQGYSNLDRTYQNQLARLNALTPAGPAQTRAITAQQLGYAAGRQRLDDAWTRMKVNPGTPAARWTSTIGTPPITAADYANERNLTQPGSTTGVPGMATPMPSSSAAKPRHASMAQGAAADPTKPQGSMTDRTGNVLGPQGWQPPRSSVAGNPMSPQGQNLSTAASPGTGYSGVPGNYRANPAPRAQDPGSASRITNPYRVTPGNPSAANDPSAQRRSYLRSNAMTARNSAFPGQAGALNETQRIAGNYVTPNLTDRNQGAELKRNTFDAANQAHNYLAQYQSRTRQAGQKPFPDEEDDGLYS